MRKILQIIIIFFLISSSGYAKDLYFAGFSFLGNADQDFRYPVAINLFDTNNTVFKNPLDTALKKLNRNDINLIYDLGKISSGEALAISFSLTDEVIERFSTKDGVTNAYKIFAQILVFDFNEKTHLELSTSLNLLDLKRGAKISGSGFPIYVGKGAELERKLINFMGINGIYRILTKFW